MVGMIYPVLVKRYLLFGGYAYYPRGGWSDLQGSFDSVEEAVEAANAGESMIAKSGYDWWQIVDTQKPWYLVQEHWVGK